MDLRRMLSTIALLVVLTTCGRGESTVDPGPGQPDESTSTSEPADDQNPDDADGNDDGEVRTGEDAPTTSVVTGSADDGEGATSTTVVIDESSQNAAEYTELAASGLVLTLEEQACADAEVDRELAAGSDRLDAVITAVQVCATPKAVDDFASQLLSAGGEPLPPTEAACVAGELRSDEGYRPFWAALFAEESFDFLAVDTDVQNQYLDLFARCVSVGRALSAQTGAGLSAATIGCIDGLFEDREFVRSSIEADLSADADEIRRLNNQIGSCLSRQERADLGL